MNVEKFSTLGLIRGVSNEKKIFTNPLEITWNNNLHILYILSTNQKDVSSFSKNSEKLSKLTLFLGCCNGKTQTYDQVIWIRILHNLCEMCYSKQKSYLNSLCVLSAIKFFRRHCWRKNYCLTLVIPPGAPTH